MTFVDTAQSSLIGVFNSLPLVLMTVLIVLGLGLGNFGMLWVAGGHIVLFPIVGALHFLTMWYGKGIIPYSDTLVLAPGSSSKINIIPSMWITQITYFFTYVFLNAYDIYNSEPVTTDPSYDIKVNNRKTRTIMIMTWAVILGLILIACRILAKSEYTSDRIAIIASVAFSLLIGGSMAAIANIIGNQPNVGTQKMDIFGITQQMFLIPKSSQVTVCQTAGPIR
jgi:hypothetical protein